MYSHCNCTEHYRTTIFTYEYYLNPVAIETIPLKKTETVDQYPAFTYFSVGGSSLDFDISVTVCTTVNCSNERVKAAAISSKNHGINLQED